MSHILDSIVDSIVDSIMDSLMAPIVNSIVNSIMEPIEEPVVDPMREQAYAARFGREVLGPAVCGFTLERGQKVFFLPNELVLALTYVF